MVYVNELYHHGIKGQRWGVRRFQNPDGTLTTAGKKRKSNLNGSDGDNNHDRLKKAAIIGGAVAAAGLAVYGGYRFGKEIDWNKRATEAVLEVAKNRVDMYAKSDVRDFRRFGIHDSKSDSEIYDNAYKKYYPMFANEADIKEEVSKLRNENSKNRKRYRSQLLKYNKRKVQRVFDRYERMLPLSAPKLPKDELEDYIDRNLKGG